jgi:hypothetical protein
MITPASNDPWVVFDYEADMFFAMCDLLSNSNQTFAAFPHQVRNAVVESALLHTRQLADILLSRGSRTDDINLNSLIPNPLPARLAELGHLYGSQNTPYHPCWTINKMLAHPTTQRTASYDYTSLLSGIAPVIAEIVQEVRARKQNAAQA